MEYHANSEEPYHLAMRSEKHVAERAAHDAPNSPDAFQVTVELSASGICHIDLTGRFLYVNPALCQLTGYSREDLLALTFQDITHPDDVADIRDDFRRLIAGEIPASRMEKRYYRRDGSMVWVSLTVTLRRTSSGRPRYVIAIVDDISERKQLESQLRAANEQLALTVQESQLQANDLEAIVEAITDLVIVFDGADRVRRVNKAVRDFGGPHSTVEAGRRSLNFVDLQGQPLPRERLVSTRVLRGETITGADAVDELAHTEAGREVFFNISGAPVRDPEGRIVGGVLVLRDVTERRRLERRTREALQALLQMAEALVAPAPTSPAPQPGASADDRAAIPSPMLNPVAQRLAELTASVLGCQRVGIVALTANRDTMHPVALTGLPPEQAAGWCEALEGQSMTDYIGAGLVQNLRAGEAVQIDLERPPIRAVAHSRPIALAVPLRLGDELVGGLALAFEHEPHAYTEDELALAEAVGKLTALVIERERLLQEREQAHASALALKEANRRMEEFLGIASHELRTPLASLLGNLQLLQRRLARARAAGKAAEDLASQLHMVDTLLEPMSRQGKRLNRIVGDMVNISRVQSGKLELHLQPCDLAAIVREFVEDQRQAEPERTINLTLPGDAQVPIVADADRIGQVVTNYLTNALKYSREDQPVEVLLQVDGDMARVSVRDEGPGLPPKEQARIWDLFHRAPGVYVQSGSGIGLGLGLHICKSIIERHGGHVGVDSIHGQGSTFWFTLPLAVPSQASPSIPPRDQSSTIQ